jgi:hypothetical protein
MFKRFPFPLVLALLTPIPGLLVPAFASATEFSIDQVTVKNQRRTLDVKVQGTTTLPTGTLLKLSFGKGPTRVLDKEVQVEDGGFQSTLSIRGLVLPDQYDVQISLAKNQKAWIEKKLKTKSISKAQGNKIVRIGDPKDVQKARERLRQWLIRANNALSGLAIELERFTVWHWTAIKNSPGQGKAHEAQLTIYRNYLANRSAGSFYERSQVAHMDLSLYRRRLVFDPYGSAAGQLQALLELIQNRAKSYPALLQKAARGAKTRVPVLDSYLALQKQINSSLKLDQKPSFLRWTLGPSSTPEIGTLDSRVYKSKSAGFELIVPFEWRASPSKSQGAVRLNIRPNKKANAAVQITILDGSDADLLKMTGIAGWESWQSYQRISLTKLNDGRPGVRHEFRATQRAKTTSVAVRVLELRIKRKDGGLLIMTALTPLKDYVKFKSAFEEIAGSLTP